MRVLDEIVKLHFQRIDEELAFEEVPVTNRVLPAAIKFVEEAVIDANIDPNDWKPGESSEFVQQRWFRIFYSYAKQWYDERYGLRHRRSDVSHFRSIVLIAGTPFPLRIPVTRSKPEIEGETVTLTWPGAVLEDENPLDWIEDPPTFVSYSKDTLSQAKKDCTRTANRIRAIACRIIGAELLDEKARSVLAGIKLHLQSAASLILREDEEGRLARAQWELQMACESAYKGVLQQQTGTFPEHHDLFMLDEAAKRFTGRVPVDWLRALPRWNDAANLRYGLGDVPTINEIISWYNMTLTIIGAVLANIKGHKLEQASITLKKPSWLRDFDDPS